MIKTYSELCTLRTFKERYEYLRIDAKIGAETFGWDRCLNQALYTSTSWKKFRRDIIIRDNACDLGLKGMDIINENVVIHHINPITKEQILNGDPAIFDPENVISCRDATHKAIHYGTYDNINLNMVQRVPNDTCPWKRIKKDR